MHFSIQPCSKERKHSIRLDFCAVFQMAILRLKQQLLLQVNYDARDLSINTNRYNDFPFSGYTPGQVINVKVSVQNDSKQILSRMAVQLCKVRSQVEI